MEVGGAVVGNWDSTSNLRKEASGREGISSAGLESAKERTVEDHGVELSAGPQVSYTARKKILMGFEPAHLGPIPIFSFSLFLHLFWFFVPFFSVPYIIEKKSYHFRKERTPYHFAKIIPWQLL
jgi:hypothetical protein